MFERGRQFHLQDLPAPRLIHQHSMYIRFISPVFCFHYNWYVMRRLDAFVMGAGTGGCLAGVSLFLREKGSPAKVFLVDPPGSALYNRVRHGVCYSTQMSEREVRKHRCGGLHYGTVGRNLASPSGSVSKQPVRSLKPYTVKICWTMAHRCRSRNSSMELEQRILRSEHL